MKGQTTAKDIRVKNPPPEVVKGLAEVCIELKEATIAKALKKMIPRYWDFKKRIEEQNKEIAELSQRVRAFEMNESTLKESFERHVRFLNNNLNSLQQNMREAVRMRDKFGTKKESRKPAPGQNKKKLSTPKKKK